MNSSVALTKNRTRRTMILTAPFYQEYGESCRFNIHLPKSKADVISQLFDHFRRLNPCYV